MIVDAKRLQKITIEHRKIGPREEYISRSHRHQLEEDMIKDKFASHVWVPRFISKGE